MKTILIFTFSILFHFPIFSQNDLLASLLKSNPDHFQHLIDSLEKYQIQIVFTQIDRDKNNFPHFKSHTFNLDENRYFYPASTVKMPTAFIALEKLNELSIIGLDKFSNMQTGAGHEPQKRITIDTSAKKLSPSVAHYVKKVFIVSDNDAQNRLYEFVGQKELNEGLRTKGFNQTRIIHRLSASGYDFEANQYTNPVSFFGTEGLLYHQGEVKSSGFPNDWNVENEVRGLGYMDNLGTIINEAFDFREKNFLSLSVLHDLMKTVIFPEAVPAKQQFNLSQDDYQFLYQVMSELPQESGYPNYGNKADNYCKFFIFGEEKEDFKIPKNIRIFNKVGWAYGFLSDVSYVVDFENKVEFLVAAVIHVNENQIYNDGNYEYENIGLPFFAKLGKVLYELELNREKKFLPDLSKYKVKRYD